MPALSVELVQPSVIAEFDPPRFIVEAWKPRWDKWERVGADSDEIRALKIGRDWSNKHDVRTRVLDRRPENG